MIMDRLEFIGTGAADWSIENKGAFFRRNSAALLNGDVLLDCGPHIRDYEECTGESKYGSVSIVAVTHAHADHFNLDTLRYLSSGRQLLVTGDDTVKKAVTGIPGIGFIDTPLFKETVIAGYTFVAVPSNHAPDMYGFSSRHYIIGTPSGGKMFYGLDGAWFENTAWHEMCRHKFDLMVLDCTVGDSDDWRLFEHNTIPMLRIMTKGIDDKGILNPNGHIYASHFARTLHASPDETKEILSAFGVRMAYDGLTVGF